MIKIIKKYSADWCGPCKVFHKTFEDVSKMDEFKDINFEEMDVEENELEVEKYQVRAVPTTVILDENDELKYKLSGNISKDELINIIKKAL
jgi:thioredoxin 1